MYAKILGISLAAVLAAGLTSGEASADHRKKPRRIVIYDQYYAPSFVSRIPGIRVLFGDYALTEDEYNELYGTPEKRKAFDESYYEPEAVPPKPQKKPATKSAKAPAKITQDSTKTASIDHSSVQPEGKSASGATTASASTAAKPASSGGSVSCDKANEIIGGYGFAGITAQSCKGKVYAFNATRDGKNFAIKLDSSSGELTEVKKLP